jgi:predicted nucleic acid-binding protein
LVTPSWRGDVVFVEVSSVADHFTCAHLDEEIATLRARHRSLELPDALVIATAEHSRADRLITTDRKWPSAKAMKLTVSITQI